MEKRKLGRSGIEISPFCLGGNVFGWTLDESTSFRILDAFVDSGFDFVDTADVYSRWKPGNSGGESETILGNWFRRIGKRGKIVIATKVGMELSPDRKGLRKEYILRAVEDSLRRLRTDVIDLYQAHADDPETPLEETLEAFDSLVKSGKVRAIGASNYSAPRLREAISVSRKSGLSEYVSLQPRYNLYDRAVFEAELGPAGRELGLSVLPYYSLASGFLSGKYRSESDLSKSPRGNRTIAERYLNPRGMRILEALDSVSAETGAPNSTIALAWLSGRPGVTAPIASATSLGQLRELTDAFSMKLSPESIDRLDSASAE